MYITRYQSTLAGELFLASDGNALCGLWLEGQKYFCSTLGENPTEKENLPIFSEAARWLDSYFAGQRPQLSNLPLSPAGSDFRRAVWDILLTIPYGKVITYGDIARQMMVTMNKTHISSRAVGGAVGHNPISIIIPCHRVVGTGGNLTGYAGGIGAKVKLLEHEGADMSRLHMPK